MNDLFAIPNDKIESMVQKGLKDVFKTMLQSDIVLQSSADLGNSSESASPLSQLDDTLVVGNVGFVGKVSGMVYLAMPERVALSITTRMLGMDASDLDGEYEMINDVIGEITNMSAGAYKNQMADMGYPCRLTIPSIIRGKYFVVEAAKASFRQIYVFKYEGKLISFELIMKENGAADE